MSGIDSTLEVDNETLKSVLIGEESDSKWTLLHQSIR